MRLRPRRLERQGLVAGGEGIFRPISRREHDGKVDVRRGMRGLELDGPRVGARGLGVAALAFERLPRLKWARACRGAKMIAFSQAASASSNWPSSPKTALRFTSASG